MKRILLAVSMLALFLPVVPQTEARTDVSIDFFYNNLGNDGSWTQIGDYGYGWQPSVAVSNRNWRPYSDGYWAYTDVGWTWVSYEDFGWATYHYGRWTRLRDRGWFWIPGREWGPAWVSWRSGGNSIGWAPLPPRGGGEYVYEGRPVNGQVDLDYDIGPLAYNFIDVRYIGEPLLRERIYDSGLNYGYCNRTVNVTNITYNNSTVYNYGPDYNALSGYSARPIQRLSLQRDTSADFAIAAQTGAFTKVQGDKLIVAAPQTLQKSATPIAPKVVKEKIAQPNIENGWMGTDQKALTQLKQKMKTEDPKNVPPPDIKPKTDGTTAAAASTTASPASTISPATAASPATPASPAVGSSPAVAASPATPAQPAKGKGKGKDKRGDNAPPFASPGPAASVAPTDASSPAAVTAPPKTAGSSEGKGKGKGKDKRAEKAPPFVSPAPAPTEPTDAAAPAPPPSQEKSGKNKNKDKRAETAPRYVTPVDASVPPGQSGAAPVAPETAAPAKRQKGQRDRALEPGNAPSAAAPDTAPAEPRGKHNRDRDRSAPPVSDAPARESRPAPAAEAQERPKKVQPVMPERAPAPEGAVRDGEQRPGKGGKQKKGGAEAPTPTPAP